jgi:hypothetical protein
MTGRRQREFALLPPGIVQIVTARPSPGHRPYMTVAILGEDQARALPGGST